MHGSDRRRFLIGAAAFLAARPVWAQSPRVARVGVLGTWPPSNPAGAPTWRAFHEELRRRGWEEGRNLLIEGRYTEARPESNAVFAGELVAAGVDVIVAGNSQAVDAVRKATRSIPIVMTNVSHVVEAGYVASLAHPGGNVTGVTNQLSDLMAKHLEFLLQLSPGLKKVGVLWSPDNTGSALAYKDMEAVARGLGIDPLSLPVSSRADLDLGLAIARRESVRALHVHPTAAIGAVYRQIRDWALQQRAMTISGSHAFTRGGFLMSYGADFAEIWRISASFVDRILRGANAKDLPVQQPTRFELVINMKIAGALGVTVPPLVLVRADEVIR